MTSIPRPPLFLATQYYRPPFPESRHWKNDLRAMRDHGFDTVQFWMVWGWCEPAPGRYQFDTYDRLMDEAGQAGLKVILSTLVELQPFWIHRVHPDAAMVDIEGNAVPSCVRCECLSGLTPGGCSNHPAIRRRMIAFLKAAAKRFNRHEQLYSWNSWNENRWRNHAPDYVCFCKHCTKRLHQFLEQRYGGLEGVGRAWGRRFSDWRDVRVNRLRWSACYPEWRDFTDFLIERARETARWRFETLASVKPRTLINNHTGNPSVFGGVNLNENAFSRGLDWENAQADAYGFSAYPFQIGGTWGENKSNAEQYNAAVLYCLRLSSCLQVANGKKPILLNELQGGPMNIHSRYSRHLSGLEQQTWIWSALARGIRGVVLWQFRSEYFGGESNQGAITSEDGSAEDRKIEIQRTARVIERRRATLDAYVPDPPQIGVVWNRDSYTLDYISHISLEGRPFPYRAPGAWLAYPIALEEMGVSYSVYDEHHLPIDQLPRLMIVPRPLGLRDAAAEWLVKFARQGGTVFTEAGAGAHDEHTFFRHVGDKPFFQAIGVREILYRGLTRETRTISKGALGNPRAITLELGELESTFAMTGKSGRVHELGPDRFPMLAEVPIGKGRVIVLGTMLGHGCNSPKGMAGLRDLLESLCHRAGVDQRIRVHGARGGFVTAYGGQANGKRLLFVVNMGVAQDVTITGAKPGVDWFDHKLRVSRKTITVSMQAHDRAVLEWK